jgi:hypothetical protein
LSGRYVWPGLRWVKPMGAMRLILGVRGQPGVSRPAALARAERRSALRDSVAAPGKIVFVYRKTASAPVGIVNVHSGADGPSLDGTAYSSW